MITEIKFNDQTLTPSKQYNQMYSVEKLVKMLQCSLPILHGTTSEQKRPRTYPAAPRSLARSMNRSLPSKVSPFFSTACIAQKS
jgi:hypothetical protein